MGGYEGDGDITNPANQSEFRDYIMKNTNREGVHFVMADGVSMLKLMATINTNHSLLIESWTVVSGSNLHALRDDAFTCQKCVSLVLVKERVGQPRKEF